MTAFLATSHPATKVEHLAFVSLEDTPRNERSAAIIRNVRDYIDGDDVHDESPWRRLRWRTISQAVQNTGFTISNEQSSKSPVDESRTLYRDRKGPLTSLDFDQVWSHSNMRKSSYVGHDVDMTVSRDEKKDADDNPFVETPSKASINLRNVIMNHPALHREPLQTPQAPQTPQPLQTRSQTSRADQAPKPTKASETHPPSQSRMPNKQMQAPSQARHPKPTTTPFKPPKDKPRPLAQRTM